MCETYVTLSGNCISINRQGDSYIMNFELGTGEFCDIDAGIFRDAYFLRVKKRFLEDWSQY